LFYCNFGWHNSHVCTFLRCYGTLGCKYKNYKTKKHFSWTPASWNTFVSKAIVCSEAEGAPPLSYDHFVGLCFDAVLTGNVTPTFQGSIQFHRHPQRCDHLNLITPNATDMRAPHDNWHEEAHTRYFPENSLVQVTISGSHGEKYDNNHLLDMVP